MSKSIRIWSTLQVYCVSLSPGNTLSDYYAITLRNPGYSDPAVIDAGDTDVYIEVAAVRVVDRTSKNRVLKIKEALHIQMTPDNNKFNRDIGLDAGCLCCMQITHQDINSKCTL